MQPGAHLKTMPIKSEITQSLERIQNFWAVHPLPYLELSEAAVKVDFRIQIIIKKGEGRNGPES